MPEDGRAEPLLGTRVVETELARTGENEECVIAPGRIMPCA
jgi:hypothetical protein